MDKKLDVEALIYANVSIKGTSVKTESDSNGLFQLEKLKEGNYTLVFSFIGYETKELNVQVNSGRSTEVNISLVASTVSLNELNSLFSIAKKENKPFKPLNN